MSLEKEKFEALQKVIDELRNEPGALYTLVLMNPGTDFRFVYDYDGKVFVFDTREIRETVAPIPLDHPEISAWIRDCLVQEINELHGGLFS